MNKAICSLTWKEKHAVKSDDFSLSIYIQVFISVLRSNTWHNLCTLLVLFLCPLWILLILWSSSWIHAFASGNFIPLIAFSEKTMERKRRAKTMSQASWTFCIRKQTYRVKKCRTRIAKSLRHSKSLIVWQHYVTTQTPPPQQDGLSGCNAKESCYSWEWEEEVIQGAGVPGVSKKNKSDIWINKHFSPHIWTVAGVQMKLGGECDFSTSQPLVLTTVSRCQLTSASPAVMLSFRLSLLSLWHWFMKTF